VNINKIFSLAEAQRTQGDMYFIPEKYRFIGLVLAAWQLYERSCQQDCLFDKSQQYRQKIIARV
jgi:hypothetical protein